jgi:hypothetical protein
LSSDDIVRVISENPTLLGDLKDLITPELHEFIEAEREPQTATSAEGAPLPKKLPEQLRFVPYHMGGEEDDVEPPMFDESVQARVDAIPFESSDNVDEDTAVENWLEAVLEHTMSDANPNNRMLQRIIDYEQQRDLTYNSDHKQHLSRMRRVWKESHDRRRERRAKARDIAGDSWVENPRTNQHELSERNVAPYSNIRALLQPMRIAGDPTPFSAPELHAQIAHGYAKVLKRNGAWNDAERRRMMQGVVKLLNDDTSDKEEALLDNYPRLRIAHEKEQKTLQQALKKL